MHTVYLSLGSNTPITQRIHYLSEGQKALSTLPHTRCLSHSDIYETEAWGTSITHPSFLNQIICLHTTYDAPTLLTHILTIETQNGRTRHDLTQWEDRTLDIDILFFNDMIIEHPNLSIPHPRLHQRKFILQILMDMGQGNLWHPTLHCPISTLYAQCKDTLKVQRLCHPYR